MSARINYNRITGSNIQGDATTVTEPLGTLVVTNNGDLRLHDGTTQGGVAVSGSGGGFATTSTLVNGTYTVALSTTGQLNLPSAANTESDNARIQSANSIDILANLAKWTFSTNSNLTVPGTIVGNSGALDLNYDGSVVLSGIPGVGAVIQTTTIGSSNTSTWSFGPDGTLTLPAATPVIKGGGTGTDVTIIASTGTNPQTWTFAADGNLHLPVGGDIVDSNNVSVLGGGSGTYGDSNVLALLGEFALGESVYGFNNAGVLAFPNNFSVGSSGGDATISTNNALTVYANNGVTISTMGNDYSWNFNSDGTTQFPYFKFPASDGAAYQMLQTDGSGNLTWVDNAHNYISNGTSGVTIPGENGNVTISVEGNTIAEFTPTGVNITGNLNITNSATYIVSTNTVYTDSLIEIHAPTDGIGGAWTNNDLNDIGFRFHYYDGADKNAALYMDNGTWRLKWAAEGVETNGQFVHSGLGDIEARAFYGSLKGTFTGGNYDGSGLRFDVGTGAVLYSTYDGNVYIQTGQNGTVYNTWQFTYDTTGTGGLVFPDSTVQTTAWTGTVAYSNVTGAPSAINTSSFLVNNFTAVGTTTVGLFKGKQVQETFTTLTPANASTATLDCSSGNIFNINMGTLVQNWTPWLTNLNLSSGYVTTVSIIVNQTGTAYIPTSVVIPGATNTSFTWQGGSTPTGSINKKDVIALNIYSTATNYYTVLAQLVSF